MKTSEATPAATVPGNVSTRELAATLKRTPPASGEAKAEPAAQAATVETEEAQTHEPGAETEAADESLTTVESDEAEGAERPDAETAEAEAPAGDEAEPEAEPAKAELPAELLEAIEIAKKQDGGKGKADLLKRLHKLVDARDTERNARLQAEEQAKALRTELQQARTKAPAEAAPMGVHPEVHKVQQELANVDHWLGWCEDNLPKLQSGELETVELPDGNGGKLQVGAKEVAKTLRDLQNMRQEVVTKKVNTEREVKAAFDAAYQQNHQAALTKFPEFKQPDSEWSVKLKQVLTAIPQMKSFPDHEIMIGHFFRGLELDAKAGKPAAATRKVAAAREPVRVPVEAPNSSVETDDDGAKKAKKVTQQFQKTGSTRDLARTLTANRQASRNKR